MDKSQLKSVKAFIKERVSILKVFRTEAKPYEERILAIIEEFEEQIGVKIDAIYLDQEMIATQFKGSCLTKKFIREGVILEKKL